MAYTKKEWEWLEVHFVEGCRFLYDGDAYATIYFSDEPPEKIYARFDCTSYSQHWPAYGMTVWYESISNCTWPDGSPMIPFVEYDGKPYNPVLAKIASLDARFKSKALPKTTQKALPLPA